jgi:hypothetical protein
MDYRRLELLNKYLQARLDQEPRDEFLLPVEVRVILLEMVEVATQTKISDKWSLYELAKHAERTNPLKPTIGSEA